MSYQPYTYRPLPPQAAAAARRVATIRRPPPPPRGVQRPGLGAVSTAQQLATTAVSSVPVVGPLLSNIVGPLVSIFDPGKKRDAGRKQRIDGITALANAGSLLAARQLYGGAEKGAVGAASEITLYKNAWAAFQTAHSDIATAARAAGPAGVGPDPVNGWQPPASDVAQYQAEIQAYRTGGIAATAAAAAQTRLAGFPGGAFGLLALAGIGLAFLRRR